MNRDWLAVFEALKAVYTEDAFSNMAVNEAIRHHKGCRDSFVRIFAKGVIRDTIRLDSIIDRLASSGIKGIRNRTLIILRMGIYAIDSLGSVPEHAAVNEAVTLAKKTARGTDRFVNGVLRSYIRRRDEFDPSAMSMSQRYSFPEPVIGLLQSQYGDETEKILEGLNTPPPVVLRVNRLKTDRAQVIKMLSDEGIDAHGSDLSENAVITEGGSVIASELFRNGYYSVQSLQSMLAIEAAGPKPASRVLDMCAAPGGKTAYAAELMENSGSITACDVYEHRLQLIDAAMERLGITIVDTKVMDGSIHDPALDGQFDYVIADVPCSGLGVTGSKPEIKLRTDVSSYPELQRIQESILRNAALYARPGGVIGYSTCTINKNENESVVKAVTADNSFLSVVEMKTFLPYNNSVGFFYCILRKSDILSDR